MLNIFSKKLYIGMAIRQESDLVNVRCKIVMESDAGVKNKDDIQ
jgi:hypothetical protein